MTHLIVLFENPEEICRGKKISLVVHQHYNNKSALDTLRSWHLETTEECEGFLRAFLRGSVPGRDHKVERPPGVGKGQRESKVWRERQPTLTLQALPTLISPSAQERAAMEAVSGHSVSHQRPCQELLSALGSFSWGLLSISTWCDASFPDECYFKSFFPASCE